MSRFTSLMVLCFGLVTTFTILTSCQSPEKKVATDNWPGQMQVMARDVKNLLPYIFNRQAYQDPKNRETVRRHLHEFAQAANHIKPASGKPFLGDDLLVEYSLEHLKDDLNRAAYTFDNGMFDYSRSVAKSSLNHCFRCHSVTEKGGSAPLNLDSVQHLSLEPMDKVELLVATRKYEDALTFMESLMSSTTFKKEHAFEYETLLRRYLAVVIRVEKDPVRALARLNRVGEADDTPHYLLQKLHAWKKSLKEWSKEKKVTLRDENDVFREVDRRFQKALGAQDYEKDHSGDVEYLRATSLLHEKMNLLKKPADQARALFMLGKAYEVLDDLGAWNLHESYYEACLLKDPKTELAKRCYSRLEASLYMGYSGTAGTNLPKEESDRLRRLKSKIQ